MNGGAMTTLRLAYEVATIPASQRQIRLVASIIEAEAPGRLTAR